MASQILTSWLSLSKVCLQSSLVIIKLHKRCDNIFTTCYMDFCHVFKQNRLSTRIVLFNFLEIKSVLMGWFLGVKMCEFGFFNIDEVFTDMFTVGGLPDLFCHSCAKIRAQKVKRKNGIVTLW